MMNMESITTGAITRAPRILLIGVEKIGKSSFACGTRFDQNGHKMSEGENNPILLPIKGEEGVDSFACAKFPVANSFDSVIEGLSTLYYNEHQFKTVVIDSMSSLEPLIWEEVIKDDGGNKNIEQVGGGYGKGFTASLTKWRRLTAVLDSLRNEKGMAVILTGHVSIKKFDSPDAESYDRYQLSINDKASQVLLNWVDLILFCNTKTTVKTTDAGFGKKKGEGLELNPNKRYMYTQKRPAHPGGGRDPFGQLPYEMPLDYGVFIDTVNEIMKKTGE